MKKIIFLIVVLLIGIGMYFYPEYEKFEVEKVQKEHVKELLEEKHPFEEHISTVETDASNLRRITFNEVKNAKFTKKNAIGKLSIPKLNFSIPIYTNATEKHLLIGAATLKSNQVFGQGNYLLAGHNMSRSRVLFSDIPKLKENDVVIIEDNYKQYIYKIRENKIVLPNASEVLEEDGTNKLTLITCFSIKDNSKRVVVVGNLEEIKEK